MLPPFTMHTLSMALWHILKLTLWATKSLFDKVLKRT